MPRAIVIHSGFHKTGTSTLQQVLRHNRPALKGRVRIVLRGEMRDLVHAARGYSSWRDPFTLDKFARRFRALLEKVGPLPNRVLCLSCEELSGHLPGREGIADYSAAAVLASDMARIAGKMHPGTPLCFVLTLRRPESWLRSAYWEHVKASSMTQAWPDFAAATRPGADLAVAADTMAAALPCPVHRIWLEDCADAPLGPAGPLLDLCGTPAEAQRGLTPVPPANARLDDSVLLALLAANRDYTDRDARAAAKQAILSAAQETTRD
ncbi:hypothetical protein [Antarcticimicrobium luteum]|uniref:Sulfotransferase family protein n=1 Tax=Antarcticimicrobium luteum TaxID=2547397 RepID=A0A4R5V4E4_9RHOB|nr:hypothetical protein [Antarcticimicrobium luteum]TDK46788.1 hypothetical protein E1832_11865 [Antarcticimicrobium luteum]